MTKKKVEKKVIKKIEPKIAEPKEKIIQPVKEEIKAEKPIDTEQELLKIQNAPDVISNTEFEVIAGINLLKRTIIASKSVGRRIIIMRDYDPSKPIVKELKVVGYELKSTTTAVEDF